MELESNFHIVDPVLDPGALERIRSGIGLTGGGECNIECEVIFTCDTSGNITNVCTSTIGCWTGSTYPVP
jgi:hypothetical protein